MIAYIRVVDGCFAKGEPIRAMAAGTQAEIDDIGFFRPAMTRAEQLAAGEVGYLITGLKDVTQLRVGDTLTTRSVGHARSGTRLEPREANEPLPGYREVKPMVFCGLFPIDSDAYPDLRDALEKLMLNDAALSWEPETSDALGFGFRCGFLGLLHMDIVRERSRARVRPRAARDDALGRVRRHARERRADRGPQSLRHARPGRDRGDPRAVHLRPADRPARVSSARSWSSARSAAARARGCTTSRPERVQLTYDLPLAEIVLDFFDQLKSRTRGYASLDYELDGMRPSDLVKLDVLLAGDPVDALSMVVHREKAYEIGRALTEKLRKRIPRQQYDVPIQAAIGSHIIARETVKAFRKDVIAKCYGGDITRKKKLLDEAEGGQETDEAGRPHRGSPGGVSGGARAGRAVRRGGVRRERSGLI